MMTHRPRLLIEADMLDARDQELACDLADDQAGVDAAKTRLDQLLDEYVNIPKQRQP